MRVTFVIILKRLKMIGCFVLLQSWKLPHNYVRHILQGEEKKESDASARVDRMTPVPVSSTG